MDLNDYTRLKGIIYKLKARFDAGILLEQIIYDAWHLCSTAGAWSYDPLLPRQASYRLCHSAIVLVSQLYFHGLEILWVHDLECFSVNCLFRDLISVIVHRQGDMHLCNLYQDKVSKLATSRDANLIYLKELMYCGADLKSSFTQPWNNCRKKRIPLIL